MPRITILSRAAVATNAPGQPGAGPPAPVTSPLVLSTPGSYSRRLPLDASNVVVELLGGGGAGAHGTSSAAGSGGSGGGYAKFELGAPAFVSGSKLLIELGAGGIHESATLNGGDTIFRIGATQLASAGGGEFQGAGGKGVIPVHAGVTSVATNTGTTAAAAVGTTGGHGGAGAVTIGGPGGAGGADTKAGANGIGPGGGAGGGGQHGGLGGDGSAGRVVITWD